MDEPITWSFKPFEALTTSELYELLALRQEVFVVEQKCPYRDCDDHDRRALHLLGRTRENMLVAYARALPPRTMFRETSIGRVATHRTKRGMGLGRALIQEAVARTRAAFGTPIRIGAQQYLVDFYRDFGFVAASAPYDEDGIVHVEMVLLE